MTTNKTENIRKKRGRPVNENKSTPVHCRVRHDLYQLLIKEQNRQEKDSGHKPALAAVLLGLARKGLNSGI